MASATSLDDETAKKVTRQVEFYFGDSNLPRDAFLSKTVAESDDGMVSLALISSFSRMRAHLGLRDVKPENVSNDTVSAVAETLRASTFLKVSEDGKKVGRVTELPKHEEVIKQLDIRTIAASPLEYDVKLEDVESFFAQFGKVNSVRLPRHVADKKLFCGTALIEFAADEDAESILKQTLCFAGAELELKPKKDFDAEIAEQEENVSKTRFLKGSRVKSDAVAELDYPKGLIVAFKLQSLSAVVPVEQSDNPKSLSDTIEVCKTDGKAGDGLITSEDTEKVILGDFQENDEAKEGEEKEVDKIEAGDEVQPSEDVEKSCGAPNEKERERPAIEAYKDNQNVVLREDLKSVLQKFGTVKFIDFKIGSDSGYVRFEVAEAAQKARAAAVLAEKGGLIVKNFRATLEPVTGDTEKEYWNLLRSSQSNHRDNFRGHIIRGGKNNRGRHFGGKQSRERAGDSNIRQNKARKFE